MENMRTLMFLVVFAGSLSSVFGQAPRDLEPFLRHVVLQRTANGLERIVDDPTDARHGTVYGGTAEDANIAWVAAAAYRHEWSRFHRDAAVREKSLKLLDRVAELSERGIWAVEQDALFGLHSFSFAVLRWLETETVGSARRARWQSAVADAADRAMAFNHARIGAGNYANPEFYYLSGLAAAWKVCGDRRYLDEAFRAFHRYKDAIFPGGGVPYHHDTAPVHNYQQLMVKAVALFWDLTGDEQARSWLSRMAPYFPRVQHRSGLLVDYGTPWLKREFYTPMNPAAPAILASVLGDGANRHSADVATRVRADNVNGRLPGFLSDNPNWYNYHQTTLAVVALRMIERYPLPEAAPPGSRRVEWDGGFRGGRSHWDDFTAAVGTRSKVESVAGAAVADSTVPMLPLGSALDSVFFEVLSGDRSNSKMSRETRLRTRFGVVEWNPEVRSTVLDDIVVAGVWTRLCNPYWSDRPFIRGETVETEISNWSSVQHWAVWRDHLVGLGALKAHESGGSKRTSDVARVRWRFSPRGRDLVRPTRDDDRLQVRYGDLDVDLIRLDRRGPFQFADARSEAPHLAWAPSLERRAPWAQGDYVHVATDARPAGSDGTVLFGSLKQGAAAILVEPGARQAYLVLAGFGRHWRQHELRLPPGITARVFKRDVELTPPPAGKAVVLTLHGAENAIVSLVSQDPIDPVEVLSRFGPGRSRVEGRPPKDNPR